MKRSRNPWGRRALALALALGVSHASGMHAAKETLKVATLAPTGSVWYQGLRELGGRWAKATGSGGIQIFADQVAGDETDYVRKMRIGQLQGAGLTTTGLSEIDPAFKAFQIPMLFRTWEELAHVLAEIGPELDRRLEAKGFHRLLWAHGGWVHLFSRAPIRTVEDLKRQKLFVWAGDDPYVQLWRRSGYQPVPLAAPDVLMGFQTRMIDVVPTPPLAALSFQWYEQTKFMTELGLAPLAGAVIVTRVAWDKLAPESRAVLTEAARDVEAKLARDVPAQDVASIVEMRRRGLTVVVITPAEQAAWRAAAEAFVVDLDEGSAPRDIVARLEAALASFRATTERAP